MVNDTERDDDGAEDEEGGGCEDCGYVTNSCQCPVDIGIRLIRARQAKAVQS